MLPGRFARPVCRWGGLYYKNHVKTLVLFIFLVSGCGSACPTDLVVSGEPPPGWEAVVRAAELKCGHVSGSIYFARDTLIPCRDIDPEQVSGCSNVTGCGVNIAVRWNSMPHTTPDGHVIPVSRSATETSEGHELCHTVCGILDEDSANKCSSELSVTACSIDPIDCVESGSTKLQ